MSKPKPQFQPSNALLVEVPPQFIALCEASGASPQAALRGMAAMVCSTTSAIGWCRWTAPPRDVSPGAGHSRARISHRVCLGAPLSSRRHEKPVRPAAPYEKLGASARDAPPDLHHPHPFIVIPAQAGIPLSRCQRLDSDLRRNDEGGAGRDRHVRASP
jgi:hypothetical protein